MNSTEIFAGLSRQDLLIVAGLFALGFAVVWLFFSLKEKPTKNAGGELPADNDDDSRRGS